MNLRMLYLQLKDPIIGKVRKLLLTIGTYLVNISKPKLTLEDLLVREVMRHMQEVIDFCPFRYLLIMLPITVPNNPDIYVTYIIKDGILYEDANNLIRNKVSQDLDIDKYCFTFNGKPKSFLDLERYQFIYLNKDLIKKHIYEAVDSKKIMYKI